MQSDVTVSQSQRGLQCGSRWLDLSRPCVMGILNVTPDSFSDGGRLSAAGSSSRFSVSLDKALRAAERMVQEGALIIDVGGESTRPGSVPPSEQEELDRVLPVVEAINRELDVIISVDTSSPSVIAQSALAGAGFINDIRALQRPGALSAASGTSLAVCLMHMQGEPATMQQAPAYTDVVREVQDFLKQRLEQSVAAGIAPARLCVDPGFGFGKTLSDNYRLLAALSEFRATGVAVLAGISRKSMIGQVTGRPVGDRLAGSVAAAVLAVLQGADIVRVHDVAATVDALKVVLAARRPDIQLALFK